ncbi:MAG: hypothetical protein P8Y74_17590, partial [Desulfobacterales bacterium]
VHIFDEIFNVKFRARPLREKLYRYGSLTHHIKRPITAFETVFVAFNLKAIIFAFTSFHIALRR